MGAIVKGMQSTTKDPYNIKFIRKVNEPATVDFTILKTENEENANYKIGEVIAFKDLTFVVDKAEEVDDGNGIVTLEVALVQNCINLSRVYATPKVYTSTQFYTIARELLSGTGWSLGDDDLSASLVLDFEIKEEQTVMNALIGLVEKVGAVLIFEQNTRSVYRSLGKQLPIASTANIVSLNANADVGKLLTRLYGKGGKNEQGEVVDITSANITGLPYVENYSYFLALGYTEKYIKDNPSLFVREGIYKNEDVLDANILLKETQDHLLRYCKPSMTCNLKLSMPDSVSCDAVKLNMRRDVYNEQTKESIPCRITSITQEFNDELTLNLVLESNFTYGSYASNIKTKLDKIQAEWSDTWDEYMEGVIKDATDLIKNGINGYVVVNKNEILIMDTDNKETAVNVWRWNSGGLGFSSNGYNGTYSTAMTKDGKIVADMITAGVMNAKIIKAGVLQSLNNKTWINMEDGTFSFYDKIKFDGTTFTIKLNSGNTVENEIDTAIDRYKQTVDKEFDDVRKKVDGLGDTLTDSFKDGIISEAEAIAIEQQLKNLDVEKKDIDSIYTTLYANTDLTGTAKTNLYKAKNSYNTAHSSLIDAINSAISDRKITNIEKSNVQSAFANYGTALANFSKACEEASNAIAEKKKQDVINYTDTQFNILDGKIQSKITSAQAQSIAEQTVNSFKQEVSNTYISKENANSTFLSKSQASSLTDGLQKNLIIGGNFKLQLFDVWDNSRQHNIQFYSNTAGAAGIMVRTWNYEGWIYSNLVNVKAMKTNKISFAVKMKVESNVRSAEVYLGYYNANKELKKEVWIQEAPSGFDGEITREGYTVPSDVYYVALRIDHNALSKNTTSNIVLFLDYINLVEGDTVPHTFLQDDGITLKESYSKIEQTAESINQTVSKKVNADQIISSINQTAEEIKIQASRINLDGYVFVSTQLTSPHITGSALVYIEKGGILSCDGETYATKLYVTDVAKDCYFISDAPALFKNTITAKKALTAEDRIYANKGLSVTDGATIAGNIILNGYTLVKGNSLGVEGNFYCQSGTAQVKTLKVDGTGNISDTLTVGSTVYIGGSLEVHKFGTSLKQLEVTSGTTLNTLNVTGATTLNTLKTQGTATINGYTLIKGSSLGVEGNIYCQSGTTQVKTLKVDGNGSVSGTLNVGSTVYVGGSLETTYGATVGSLGVNGTSTLKGYTVVKDSLGVERHIYCNGNIEALASGYGSINANYLGSMGNIACRGTLSGSNLSISGSKNCVQDTEHFGKRLVNAYETADYYFGDIGESKLENGECVVFIDDVFKEIINLDYEYQVFLTKYGRGDIWVAERNKDCFVVQGENDISFGWEIKGKRKGYETNRLEEYKEVDNFVQKDNTI